MRRSRLLFILPLILFVLFAISPSFGQSGGPFEISPSAITGGGNTTSNAAQSISGSIGQSPLGTTAGGPFSITGGLFGFKAAAFTFGDINHDQSITVSDLIVLANVIAGNIPRDSPIVNIAAADLNSDGDITVSDLIILANFIAGNIHHLPI